MVELVADEVVTDTVGDDVTTGIDMNLDALSRVCDGDGAGDVVEFDGIEVWVDASSPDVDG